MLKNYFTIAIRTIRKRKFFASINILGMTAGIAACLLIALYVIDEFSYDRFHVNADRIYQVGRHNNFGDQDVRSASTCPPLADALISEIPEVESVLRLRSGGKPVIRYNEKVVTEDNVFFTESNFFDFFSFQLISGNTKTALKEPNTVVLTEKTARKLFGDENPLEKLITIDDGAEKIAYKITGVAADCPGNSHFRFNILLSAGQEDNYFKYNAWLNSGVFTYFLLRENSTASVVEKKLEQLVSKYVAPELKNFLGNSLDQFRKTGGVYSFYTTKITDIHLRSTSMDDIEPGGSMMYMAVFGGIGIFILAIACINFMNMSTAQSASRAKEVGLRKTLGSLRSQMIGQFLAESMLYSLVAVALAVVLCLLLLPAFNLLSGKELAMNNLLNVQFMLEIGLMLLIVGVLAGSYPAFYLTSFKPVEVLKGKVTAGFKSKGIRSTLVVFQFAISIFLIIVTAVVYTQINFMQAQQMGMDKKNVLLIEEAQKLGNNAKAFRNAVSQQTGVLKTSFTAVKFPGTYTSLVMRNAHSDGDHIVSSYWADFDSQDLLKFEMKEGRYFSKDFLSDSSAVVVNEAAAREFGFVKLEGQEILSSPNAYVFVRHHVIGIMKDFNFDSYHHKVRPLAIFLDRTPSPILMVRYEGNARKLINNTSKIWKQYASSEPFVYSFMDENFNKIYHLEEKIGQVLGVFSGLAIFIACLGLFALSTFTAEQRTKEIGIRKVLGASVSSLSMMLMKEFIVLVFIAFVPAATIGCWVSSQWLNGFAYRVEINLFIFVGAGVSAIAIAWLTVGFQSIKAARANPVDSLRHE
ncbi:ABC transporter permease [Cytophagaceae bacterium YF14B1]|uniref:ABC transporter permease n=1 Tax=Xanthocytophaga flava TaxID=3048013 RepID=A0AAE3QWF4_9BACT|nr:ABC transporter permease [Xanthocytophaga flavus]MDJ1484648.1 ABC transporter permease [Xanthocytophaga flavus]